MADLLLVRGPDGWLALTREAYAAALKAAQVAGCGEISVERGYPAAPEALCDAVSLAQSLGVPESWVAQAAREGRIPCVRLGRWVRFRRSEVEATLSGANGPKPWRRAK